MSDTINLGPTRPATDNNASTGSSSDIVNLGPVHPDALYSVGASPEAIAQARYMSVPDSVAFFNSLGLKERYTEQKRNERLSGAMQSMKGQPNQTFIELTASEDMRPFLAATKKLTYNIQREKEERQRRANERGMGDKALGTLKSSARFAGRFVPNVAIALDHAIGWFSGFADEGAKALDKKFPAVQGYGGGFKAIRDWAHHDAELWQKVLSHEALQLPKELQGSLFDNPEYLLDPEWMTQNVGDAVSSFTPALAAFFFSGGLTGVATLVAISQEAGNLYHTLLEKGVASDVAMNNSLAFGAVVGWLNKIGLDKMFGGKFTGSLGKRLVKASSTGGVEALTEYAEEPFQALFSSIAQGKSESEVLQDVAESFKNVDVIPGAFFLGGGLSYANLSVKRAEERAQSFRAEIEAKQKAALESHASLQEGIRESDRLQLKQHQELFQEYLEAGHIEALPSHVYMTSEGFSELAETEGGLLESLGIDIGLSSEDTSVGRDIRIPTSKIISLLTGENAEGILRHVKLTPDSMSAAQAQTIDIDAAVQETRIFFEERLRRTEVSEGQKQKLIAQYLNAAPKSSIGEAEAQTAPLLAFAEKVAPSVGMTPDAYLDYHLEGIVGENFIEEGVQAKAAQEYSHPATLNQVKPDSGHTYHEGKRGSISYSPDGKYTVKLFGQANKSTLLHESGHLFFMEYERLVSEGMAPEWMQKDYAELRKWSGLDSAKTEQESTAAHEKVARGFESYLRSGKAPSLGLQRYFTMFKKWLSSIYRTVKDLDVKLTPAIRQSFDRMLATDEQIGQMRHIEEESRNSFLELTDAIPGISEKELRTLHDLESEAEAEAYAAIDAQMNRDRQIRLREWQKEAVEVWNETKLGRSISGKGTVGIEAIKTDFDASTVKAILRKRPGKIVNDGLPYDMAAVQYGYEDGEQFVLDLLEGPTKSQFIEQFISDREAEHDNVVKQDLEGETEAYARFLEMQEKILSGKMLDYKPITNSELDALSAKNVEGLNKEEIKDFVERTGKTLRDVKKQALQAKRNLAKAVQEKEAAKIARQVETDALKSKASQAELESRKSLREEDLRTEQAESEAKLQEYIVTSIEKERAKLYEAIKKQRKLHADRKAGQKAKQEQQRIVRYFKRVAKAAKKGKVMTADANEQIRTVLDGLDLRNISQKELDRRTNLSAWVQARDLEGIPYSLPARVIADLGRVHYKQMTLEELREVAELIKYIETQGRADKKATVAGETYDFNKVCDDLVKTVKEESDLEVKEGVVNLDETLKDKVGDWFGGFFSSLIKVEYLFDRMDGGKAGVWTNAIFRPISEALDRVAIRQGKAATQLKDIFSQHFSKKDAKDFSKKLFVNDRVGFLRKEQIISIGLNRGNAHNLEAVMQGYKWNLQDVEDALFHLEKHEWNYIQSIWDYLDAEYWGDISSLYKELAGNAPEKVQPTPFVTQGGLQMRGGYYPVHFDSKGIKANQQIETSNVNEQFGTGFSTYTKNGHTKARSKSGGKPVYLSLSVLPLHVSSVIIDLELRKPIIGVNRLLNNPKVVDIIGRTLGSRYYREITKWLASCAGNRREAEVVGFGRVLRFFRRFRTFAAMGFKMTTFLAQGAGLFNSAGLVGSKNIAKSLREVVANPKEIYSFVYHNSEFMRHRRESSDREIYAQCKTWGKKGWSDKVIRAGFWHIQQADYLVSTITWKAAYDKALHEGMLHKKAVSEGDRAVRMSQGSGRAADLAAIQRGGEALQTFTMFYSFFSAQFNQFYKTYYDHKRTGNKAEFIARTWWLWFAPAIVSELMSGRGPEEDEDWWKWAGKEILIYPTAAVPGLRDFIKAATSPYGSDGTLLGEVGEALGSFAREAGDEDEDVAALVNKGLRIVNAQSSISIGQFVEFLTGKKRDYTLRDVFLKDKE